MWELTSNSKYGRSRGFSRVWTMRVERANPAEASTPVWQSPYLELLGSTHRGHLAAVLSRAIISAPRNMLYDNRVSRET